jgi:hypothetical protein
MNSLKIWCWVSEKIKHSNSLSLSIAFTSAPHFSIRYRITSRCPLTVAKWRGMQPYCNNHFNTFTTLVTRAMKMHTLQNIAPITSTFPYFQSSLFSLLLFSSSPNVSVLCVSVIHRDEGALQRNKSPNLSTTTNDQNSLTLPFAFTSAPHSSIRYRTTSKCP